MFFLFSFDLVTNSTSIAIYISSLVQLWLFEYNIIVQKNKIEQIEYVWNIYIEQNKYIHTLYAEKFQLVQTYYVKYFFICLFLFCWTYIKSYMLYIYFVNVQYINFFVKKKKNTKNKLNYWIELNWIWDIKFLRN